MKIKTGCLKILRSFSDDNFEDTKSGPSKNVNLCDESQVATDENCIFNLEWVLQHDFSP